VLPVGFVLSHPIRPGFNATVQEIIVSLSGEKPVQLIHQAAIGIIVRITDEAPAHGYLLFFYFYISYLRRKKIARKGFATPPG